MKAMVLIAVAGFMLNLINDDLINACNTKQNIYSNKIECIMTVEDASWTASSPINGIIEIKNNSNEKIVLNKLGYFQLQEQFTDGKNDKIRNERSIYICNIELKKHIVSSNMILESKESIKFKIDFQETVWNQKISSIIKNNKLLSVVQNGKYNLQFFLFANKYNNQMNQSITINISSNKLIILICK